MVVLLIVIFIGFLNHFRSMFFAPPPGRDDASPRTEDAQAPDSGEFPALWCTVPMWLALIPLLVMGLWWPGFFSHLFSLVSHEL